VNHGDTVLRQLNQLAKKVEDEGLEVIEKDGLITLQKKAQQAVAEVADDLADAGPPAS
jgi:replicative DNA helicase